MVTELSPAVAELGEAAKPMVEVYLGLLFESEGFKKLKDEGQLLALTVAIIRTGVEPEMAARQAKACQKVLTEEVQ
jgi:hypothetical protein